MNGVVKEIKDMDLPTIYICTSQYNVLLALYIITELRSEPSSFIVMATPDRKLLQIFLEISAKLSLQCIKNAVLDKKDKVSRVVGNASRKNRMIYKEALKAIVGDNGRFLLVNFAWNKQITVFPSGFYLKRSWKSIFIEEGTMQASWPDEKPIYTLIKTFFGNDSNFWENKRICSIYVQRPDTFPPLVRDRTKKFSIGNIYDNHSLKYEERIIGCFLDQEGKAEIELLRNGCYTIVFTQPLSEDGFISEKEKVEIYSNIVKKYLKYGRVAIKIHPRDTSSYSISEALILNGRYPSEIYNIFGLKFNYAIGICTSAIENVSASVKINLNPNFLNDRHFVNH